MMKTSNRSANINLPLFLWGRLLIYYVIIIMYVDKKKLNTLISIKRIWICWAASGVLVYQ